MVSIKRNAGAWLVALGGVTVCGLLGFMALAVVSAPAGTLRQALLALGALLLLAAGALAVLVVRNVLRPLQRGVQVAQRIISGDLEPPQGLDANSAKLLRVLDELREQTFKIVNDVRTRALSVATSSGHIQADQASFTSAIRNQAEAVERTASSLEQLTAAVQHNADNAASGHSLATSALTLASQGGDVMQQVIQTMGTIRGSSSKIVDIIGVIDGIAFQTNILALNAAVEAARAGEQGRGFAVVASEVRSLATRSAEAAKAVKALIDESVTAVNSGASLVDRAGETMQQIMGSVQRVTEIMTEMSAAAREQSEGIAEINDAIVKIDAGTQQNHSIMETSAEPVQALHQQTIALTEAVSHFKLGEQEFASDADAIAMVQRATQFVKVHGIRALVDDVLKYENSQFLDRDLYLVVYDMSTGRCLVHGINKRLENKEVQNLKDVDGKLFINEIFKQARAGGHGPVTYKWIHPLSQKTQTKAAHFAACGDLVYTCGAYVKEPAHAVA
jgi:methyl-accepting chemotaxis protein